MISGAAQHIVETVHSAESIQGQTYANAAFIYASCTSESNVCIHIPIQYADDIMKARSIQPGHRHQGVFVGLAEDLISEGHCLPRKRSEAEHCPPSLSQCRAGQVRVDGRFMMIMKERTRRHRPLARMISSNPVSNFQRSTITAFQGTKRRVSRFDASLWPLKLTRPDSYIFAYRCCPSSSVPPAIVHVSWTSEYHHVGANISGEQDELLAKAAECYEHYRAPGLLRPQLPSPAYTSSKMVSV